ncbi:MAG: thrombospondin type 3 repeat-containing protein [Myxococcota bacterium]
MKKSEILRAGNAGILVALLLNLALPAYAGSIQDADGDLVPDEFDNCLAAANGPNDASNQTDCDSDGYGDVCDADYDQNGVTSVTDFGYFLTVFGASFPPGFFDCRDHDANGTITASDFGAYLSQFGNPPGPSGLPCADPTLVVPPAAACTAQTP